MSSPAPLPSSFDWAHEGRMLGEVLDAVHAVVVVGNDPVATAQVALGIGETQARRRRVAVGDLLGDAPPIRALVHDDEAHGLVDSFVYGVSLNKIARAVPEAGELFVMPTGTEPVDYPDLFANPRWRRLAAGFREVGALLILAAPVDAPALEQLVGSTDGAVLVGEEIPAQLPVSKVLASVRATPRHIPAQAGMPTPAETELFPAPAELPRRPRSRWRTPTAIGGALLALLLAALGVWLATRPLDRSLGVNRGVSRDTTHSAAAPLAPVGASTAAAADTAARATALLTIGNPLDSARASAWVIELVKENTFAGAQSVLDTVRVSLPAATVGAVIVSGVPWYRVVGGAFAMRPGADSLLRVLRARHAVGANVGVVTRLPLAFLLQGSVAEHDALRLVGLYVQRGLPAYMLRRDDGMVNVYAGAFESPEQATALAPVLREAGVAPFLVYRIGRVF